MLPYLREVTRAEQLAQYNVVDVEVDVRLVELEHGRDARKPALHYALDVGGNIVLRVRHPLCVMCWWEGGKWRLEKEQWPLTMFPLAILSTPDPDPR